MDATLVISLIAVGVILWWATDCNTYPYRPCPTCTGSGKKMSKSKSPGRKKNFGTCRSCAGRAKERRIGAVLFGRGDTSVPGPAWLPSGKRGGLSQAIPWEFLWIIAIVVIFVVVNMP